ncbi:thiamine biosynthetic bifunctional enzyme [Balamuthia mandrillaris]
MKGQSCATPALCYLRPSQPLHHVALLPRSGASLTRHHHQPPRPFPSHHHHHHRSSSSLALSPSLQPPPRNHHYIPHRSSSSFSSSCFATSARCHYSSSSPSWRNRPPPPKARSVPLRINAHHYELCLYFVTDSKIAAARGRSLEDMVREAIRGGATCVQYRDKQATTKELIATARRLLEITRPANVPLIINDRVDVALAVEADGVHLGEKDMDVETARKILGKKFIIGATVRDAAQAQTAIAAGANYLGTNAVFATPTKTDIAGEPMGLMGLHQLSSYLLGLARKARSRAKVTPLVAIGGIHQENAAEVLAQGQPIALGVVSAIAAADDVAHAAGELRSIIDNPHQTLPRRAATKETEGAETEESIRTEKNGKQNEQASPTVSQQKNYFEHIARDIADGLTFLRERKPLVHQITNFVAMNDSANVTLHVGALPIMAHAEEEVEDMVTLATSTGSVNGALVLNPGTLSSEWIRSMLRAGKRANALGVPIVLDPVGAGATSFRTQTNVQLMRELKVDILKGNFGEIVALWRELVPSTATKTTKKRRESAKKETKSEEVQVETRGVESIGGAEDVQQRGRVALELARAQPTHRTIVVITGKTDVVSDGKHIYAVDNGHEMMGTITATGCMATAIMGAFASVHKNRCTAALSALVCWGLAGEKAAKALPLVSSSSSDGAAGGPASFKLLLFDALYRLQAKDVLKDAKVYQVHLAAEEK